MTRQSAAAWRIDYSIVRRSIRALPIAIGLPLGAALIWLAALLLTSNFHAVEEGVLYRSSQMTGLELKKAIERYGIRTVINLRGSHPSDHWYDEEIAVSTGAGAAHADLALSARSELSDQELNQLTTLLRDSPRPILVHCRSGADRTGLASALYEYSIAGKSAEKAREQLSFRFGHIRYFNRTVAMDHSFDRVTGNAGPPQAISSPKPLSESSSSSR